jgi:hypothetical protein
MKDAGAKLTAFGLDVAKASAAIAGALSTAFSTVTIGVGLALKEADKLGKMADSIGVPIEELSKLKYAADLSGVGIDALGKSLQVLNQNLTRAAADSASRVARTFSALGISVKDSNGNIKSASVVVSELAGKLSMYRDGAAKSAIATQLFGRSGAALIPILNQGSAGLNAMFEEAQALGIVLDQKTKDAASTFEDNLSKLSKVAGSLFVQISAQLAPALSSLAEAFLGLAKNGKFVETAANTIVEGFKDIFVAALTGVTIVERFAAEWTAFLKLMKSDNISDTVKFWNAFVAEGDKSAAAFAGIADRVKSYFSIVVNALPKKKDLDPPTDGFGRLSNAVDSFLASQSKRGAQMQAATEGLTMTTAEAEAYRMEQEALTIATEKQIPLTDQLMQKIFDAATAYGQIAEATERAKARFNELNQIGQQVGGAIGNVFQDWITKGGKFGDVLKSLASKLANIAFQAMVTKPLQNIFGNLFSGGQKPIFAASGANFTVPGTGGLDSVFTPMMLTPGENVSVTPKGGGDNSVPQVKYEFNFAPGMSPGDMARVQVQVKQAIAQSEAGTINRIRRAHQTDSSFLNG